VALEDLPAWCRRIDDATKRHLAGFEERFGYPPDRNEVVRAEEAVKTQGDGSPPTLPSDIAAFFGSVFEVHLPDVWNGYFLGPLARTIRAHSSREPRWLRNTDADIEVFIVGSDGGGALYAVEAGPRSRVHLLRDSPIVSGVAIPGRTEVLGESFDGFLEALAAAIETFVWTGTAPRF
jgi:hypothetical protein